MTNPVDFGTLRDMVGDMNLWRRYPYILCQVGSSEVTAIFQPQIRRPQPRSHSLMSN